MLYAFMYSFDAENTQINGQSVCVCRQMIRFTQKQQQIVLLCVCCKWKWCVKQFDMQMTLQQTQCRISGSMFMCFGFLGEFWNWRLVPRNKIHNDSLRKRLDCVAHNRITQFRLEYSFEWQIYRLTIYKACFINVLGSFSFSPSKHKFQFGVFDIVESKTKRNNQQTTRKKRILAYTHTHTKAEWIDTRIPAHTLVKRYHTKTSQHNHIFFFDSILSLPPHEKQKQCKKDK